MYALVLAAGVLLAGEPQQFMGVCLDEELTIVGEPRKIIDFYVVDVRGKDGSGLVSVYIGMHPDVGPANKPYTYDTFYERLKKPIQVKIKKGDKVDILGVPSRSLKDYPVFYHIFRGSESDKFWVAKHVKHCSKA